MKVLARLGSTTACAVGVFVFGPDLVLVLVLAEKSNRSSNRKYPTHSASNSFGHFRWTASASSERMPRMSE